MSEKVRFRIYLCLVGLKKGPLQLLKQGRRFWSLLRLFPANFAGTSVAGFRPLSQAWSALAEIPHENLRRLKWKSGQSLQAVCVVCRSGTLLGPAAGSFSTCEKANPAARPSGRGAAGPF